MPKVTPFDSTDLFPDSGRSAMTVPIPIGNYIAIAALSLENGLEYLQSRG